MVTIISELLVVFDAFEDQSLPFQWAARISSRSEKVLEDVFSSLPRTTGNPHNHVMCDAQTGTNSDSPHQQVQREERGKQQPESPGLFTDRDGWQGRVSELSLFPLLISLPALCQTSAELNKSHASVYDPFYVCKFWCPVENEPCMNCDVFPKSEPSV